MKIVPNADHFV